ncbi:MAG: hypothetical protein APR62_07285 [Smithella sp. SDB]|nr:MAG: hypothetical protein APR62_07285 [Smithella sp. SDB]
MDANGNRTHIAQEEPYAPSIGEGDATYTYNTQKNRLLSTSAEGSFGYDDEGQLQTGYSTDYTFDYEHRLKTITGTNAAQFFYDGSGNRLKATRSGVTTKYIYDANGRLLAEADANNNITKYYVYGNGLLAMVTPEGQTYCYHYNGIGSTIAMTNASQEIINKYSYDVFGNIANKLENILNNDTNLQNQPFTYVGQYGVMSEPNGFYYMKARYYDPTVGRFISEDPIGFDGGDVNLMAYVGNNPVTGIDPSGLCGESPSPFLQALQDTKTANNYLTAGSLGLALFNPPLGAVALGTTTVIGMGLDLVEGAITGDYTDLAINVGSYFIGLGAGKLATKIADLPAVNFNSGSMRYHSEETGRFVSNSIGRSSYLLGQGTGAIVSVPSIIFAH